MTITHHADPATLMSYAAGSLPEPLAAVIACHLAMCPGCRAEVRRLERVGAILLERMPASPVRIAPPSRAVLASMEAELEPTAPVARGDVPAPLARMVGPRLDGIAWKRLGVGVWHLPLPLSEGQRGDLRLLKVAPGQVMPEHGHGGAELTLLLHGSYRDEIGVFRAGDIADLDEDVEHQPVADPVEGCICLIASVEKARFKGLVARMIQPFTGL